MFGTMFQKTCFGVWKNIIVCLICVSVYVFFFLSLSFFFFFFFKLTSGPPGLNWRRKLYVLSNQVSPMFFKIFTKVPLSNIVWSRKTCMKSFSNSVFKHPKMSNVTQTLLKKHLYQTRCFIFLELQFLVFI